MTNDKQRERLYYLFQESKCPMHFLDNKQMLDTTDYLLANGVACPPVKIGQELWDIHYNRPRKWEVVYLGFNGKEWHISIHWWKDRHNFKTMQICYPFLGKVWYFTKEEAEQALNNIQNGNSCEGGVQE